MRHRNRGESRVWGAILNRVLARPILAVGLAGGLLVALAIPALGLHTTNPGLAGLSRSLPIMQTYDRIEAAFPGGTEPAVVAIEARDVQAPVVQAGIRSFRASPRRPRAWAGPAP